MSSARRWIDTSQGQRLVRRSWIHQRAVGEPAKSEGDLDAADAARAVLALKDGQLLAVDGERAGGFEGPVALGAGLRWRHAGQFSKEAP